MFHWPHQLTNIYLFNVELLLSFEIFNDVRRDWRENPFSHALFINLFQDDSAVFLFNTAYLPSISNKETAKIFSENIKVTINNFYFLNLRIEFYFLKKP